MQSERTVAAHSAERGSLTINGSEPASGRAAITAAAQGFMTDFPDMLVKMDRLEVDALHVEYHWTLTETIQGAAEPVAASGSAELNSGESVLID